MRRGAGIGLLGFAIIGLTATTGTAATFCVNTAQALRDALTTAQSNGADDTIKIVRGTYGTAGNRFMYQSTEAHSLTVIGGYNGDCSARIRNPALTTLDGGGQTPLFYGMSSQGLIALRFLTFQNGFMGGSSGGGLQINFAGQNGDVSLVNNIIRNNQSDYAVAAGVIGGGGTIRVENNLIIGNRAPATAGFYLQTTNAATIYFTNNTVAQNVNTGTNTSPIVYVSDDGSGHFSNNLFWSNTASSDLDWFGSVQLIDNDYSAIDGTPAAGSGGNLSVDPQFASASDFHLRSTSPLINAGTQTPVGGLPDYDLEGHDRDAFGGVDMGAYERGDEIFASDFQ